MACGHLGFCSGTSSYRKASPAGDEQEPTTAGSAPQLEALISPLLLHTSWQERCFVELKAA